VTVLVLEHCALEPAGTYGDVLREHRIPVDRVALDRDEAVPDWRPYDGILAMGGPMGACDEEAHRWLAREKRLIREAVCGGRAFLGVCLGAQLLAASFGARVWTGPEPEIGVTTVRRTPGGATDPLFAAAGDELRVLQWHADTFDLPRGATRLWTAARYANQAFSVGPLAYGLQFHLEATAALVRGWATVPEYRAALEGAGRGDAFARLLLAVEHHEDEMAGDARRMLERWIAACHDRRQAGRPASH
jgi:GMP synthase-like glutamine amidotransferase